MKLTCIFHFSLFILKVVPPIRAEVGSLEGIVVLCCGLVLLTEKFLELLIIGFESTILIPRLTL